MIRSSFTRRQSLGLLGATLTPALGPAEAYAQLLPPIPSPSHPLPVDAATALIGRYIFTSGNKGQFVLGNVGSFVSRIQWTAGVGVKFNTFPAEPGFIWSQGGVGVFADGRRLGVLALLGNDQQGRPEIVVSLSEGDVLTDPSNGFPDDVYYIALARFFAPNGGFNYIVYVDGRRVAAVTTRVAATGSQAQVLYLGTRAPSMEVGMGFPRGPVDCDFNFFQVFEQGNRDARRDSSGLNFFDDSLIMFYDFTKQPPVRVLDHALDPPFPIQKLDVSAYGTAHQKARSTQHLVTLAAKSLAPLVWLHSKEQHFPCSAEWYLSRSRIVRTTVLDPGEISPPDRLQMIPPMWTATEGPVDGAMLRAASSAPFGEGTDLFFLWPLEAKPRTQAIWRGGTCLSDYQLETVAGWLPVDNRCLAPCYCHIVSTGEVHNINYYFFYPYNGGLGAPSFNWTPTPLSGPGAGFGAHFGDWERMTAQVRVFDDRTCQVLSVELEQHGDSTKTGIQVARRNVADIPRINVYSAWHSHASYATADEQHRNFPLPNDFTDTRGATWDTGASLIFLEPNLPDWIYFNGDWGPRLSIVAGVAGLFEGQLVGGPSGPAFQDPWRSKPW